MSFGDLVNSQHAAIGSGALTINFTTVTAEKNLLIAVFSRSTASTPGTPSGWTPISNSSGGNLYGSWFYKITVGGEHTITSVDGASGNATGTVMEFEGPFAASPLDKTASDSSHLSSATKTQSSGTTATTTQAGEFVIAYFAADSGVTMAGTTALTNGFYKMSGDTTTARAYYCIGIVVPADVGTYETTFSTTGTGDEMYGAIATFLPESGGTVYEESVTIGASAGVSDAGNATMNTLETLGTILQNSMFENADMSDSAVLSAAVMTSIGNAITLNQAATLAASVAASPTNNIGMEASSALSASVSAAPANNMIVEGSSSLSASLSASQANNADMEDSSTLSTLIATSADNNANMNDTAEVGITAETNGSNDYIVNENVSVDIENDSYQFGNVDLSDTVMIGTHAALANDNVSEMGETITLAVEDILTSSGGTSFGDSVTLEAETVLSSGATATVETEVVVGLNAETDYGAKVDFEITISLGQHISVLNINQAVMETGLSIASRLAANTAITTGNNVKMRCVFCGMDVNIYIGMA
jgi:hypothetical protein